MTNSSRQVLALSGGVGGAKLSLGLQEVLADDALQVVVNTADDFDHIGLRICPDLDSVMYAMAGLNDEQRGWGLAGESWNGLAALERLGAQSWFQLGDKDLATHIYRTQMLREGSSLRDVTATLSKALGVNARLLPMTEHPVATVMQTADGELPFQHYFVREQCRPVINGFYFNGIEDAKPQPDFLRLLTDPGTRAIVICPSNPFVSVKPILDLPGVAQALARRSAPVIAVSPIVSGVAIKGPAAKMMSELGVPATAAAVAQYYAEHYGDLLDGFVLDSTDADGVEQVERLGVKPLVINTLMKSVDDKKQVARDVLAFADCLPVSSRVLSQ